jgi:hypothetical protein
VDTRRIVAHNQPSQKVHEIPSEPLAGYADMILSIIQLNGKAQIDVWSKPALVKKKARPYCKNNKHQKDWYSGSSDRASDPKFKPPYPHPHASTTKKEERKKLY